MVTSKDENPDGKRPLVSIIIPVFNASEFLEPCIESVLRQTYANLEVIVIDDGSEDGSKDLIREYTQKDGRIVAVFQKNAGASAARNIGIAAATGNYITFVDADDTLLPGAIEKMVALIQKNDVDCVRTKCNVITGNTSTALSEGVKTGIYSKSELSQLIYAAATGDMLCYSWLLMIKREAFADASLKFPVSISMMEDAWFYVDLLQKVDSFEVSDVVTYNYMVHDASASRSITGFGEKVESIVRVNGHMTSIGFSDNESAHINAVHASNIASLLMVRGDRAGIDDVYNMMDAVANNTGVARLYQSADTAKLNLYHRLATWAVIKNHRVVVRLLRFIRKVSGK